MRIDVVRLIDSNPGVTILERTELEVPLEVVVHKRLLSRLDEALPPAREFFLRRLPRWTKIREEEALLSRMGRLAWTQADGSERRVTGLLVPHRVGGLVDFLAERYVPTGDSAELDWTITRAREEGASVHALRARVDELLTSLRAPTKHFRGPILLDPTPLATLGLEVHETPEGRFGVRTIPEAVFLQLLVDAPEDLGGHTVVRASIACLRSGAHRVLWWDGHHARIARNIASLPAPLLAAFDRGGTCRAAPPGPWGTAPLLEPRFVVSVPGALVQELLGPQQQPPDDDEPPHPALADAALLFDSRDAVPLRLRDGTAPPVLTGEREARYVLSRTLRSGTMFLPGRRSLATARVVRLEEMGRVSLGRAPWAVLDRHTWVVGLLPRAELAP